VEHPCFNIAIEALSGGICKLAYRVGSVVHEP
jgi:hypothetical protein